ncbi:unnamed protein product [Rotaria sp. Silwood2]|nr:unnamed protein product [Rotaria sp. Silwood2]
MEYHENHHRHGGFIKFLNDFRALFIKTFLLTIRKPGQTIAEILLAYIFMGFLLGMRYILDRRYYSAYQIPSFYPQDMLSIIGSGDIIYYYPGNPCTTTIVTNAVNNLIKRWPNFPNNTQVIPDSTLSTLSNKTLQSIIAYIQFNNLDSCIDSSVMPNEVKYTLRMQENGPYYYHAESVKISGNDYLWKRSPEDFCQDKSSFDYYTYRFVGIQYFIDLSIIQYVTKITQNLSLSEYLRIYGLRTWVNNLVWITRSMLIFFILSAVVTGLSMIVLPTIGTRKNSVRKAIFNYTHWTLIWTILFVYSIQVSVFSVLFGQFFKRAFLSKLMGFVVWVITLIDFYPGVPVGVRYFLCLFPNTGLMFCLQVVLQYERKSSGMTTFEQLYSNLYIYPLYIGICLLLMLIYSVIYFFLAMYVERVNPGEFGVSQPWNYLFKKSYWKPHATSIVQPLDSNDRLTHKNDGIYGSNGWIELNSMTNTINNPSLTVSHLTKKFGKFQAVSDLSLNFYKGEVCSLLGHNGAGKTTTTFILVGMLEPTSGRVTVEGLDNRTHIQEVRKILGFCPQFDILYDDLSVKEHLELIGKVRHIEPKLINESIETILQLIGLVNDRHTLSKKLSGGMKRRLSIGISLMGDPKVLILDEPTSGIDPYNRRLIWTMIRKMKEAGKCIILTTHFLQEADVLSDRIAIMSNGHLQASGTPNFLKNQIDFEYRLFIDKNETYQNERITAFIQKYIQTIILERESISEMIFGIRRSESKHIGKLIHALDEHSNDIGIESYGLSMTTIEEVFLKLIHEAEKDKSTQHDQTKLRQDLANKIFRAAYNREIGARRFWFRICALIIKRWHVLHRQYIFLFGFFLFPILIEILIVSIFPTPKDIQASLVQNNRIKDAQITLLPSIYNPHTIIGSIGNTNIESEVHIYINTEQIGYFLLMIIMYSLASLPLIYVYSFSPKSELIGFINSFVINIVVCFFDMVLAFMALFSQAQSTNTTRVSRLTSIVNNIRWLIAVLFPCVNFKHSLFNIRLKSSQDCISSLNSLMFTNYSFNESWMSTRAPGVGIQFIIFVVQMTFWWIILILIEKGTSIKLGCRRCCGCENDLERIDADNPMDNAEDVIPKQWDDSQLDEDVRNERRLIFEENNLSTSSVILVRDVVKRFKKRKEKSFQRRIFTAVNHLNFHVAKRSCFGLLGANGAGKTTTFRMLINDLKPTSGEIIINGKDINKMKRDLEIGFCPQFDWLINNLTVIETLYLFARLKGLKWSEVSQICDDMIELFGLDVYETQKIQNLSGGNKRKVSAALAFMANPALVFLDEPTTGLDAAAKRKLWDVIRAARDAGLTIILTSHSMEECEALCTKIGIMKLGQFMCLGNLQRLKNRFGNGYAVQVKLPLQDINLFKEELMLTLPGVKIDEQHNGILFCTVPFSAINSSRNIASTYSLKLGHVFDLFNKKKEEKSIESYSITQTTLEQIFVHLAGEDQYINTDENKNK